MKSSFFGVNFFFTFTLLEPEVCVFVVMLSAVGTVVAVDSLVVLVPAGRLGEIGAFFFVGGFVEGCACAGAGGGRAVVAATTDFI